MSLAIVPCTIAEANAYVRRLHRHHGAVVSARLACACADSESGAVHGVALIGRPVSRMLDDGWTLEVTRLCTDGAHNACSMLYGAAWRAAQAIGYTRLITYTLPAEGGASLRGAGWRQLGTTPGGSWSVPSRRRTDKHPLGPKMRWEVTAPGEHPDALVWPQDDEAPQLRLAL